MPPSLDTLRDMVDWDMVMDSNLRAVSSARSSCCRGHLARHGPMEKGIGDVRRSYSGEVIFADELMSLKL